MSTSPDSALHHIALGAVDVERVAFFYRDVFGLAEVARHFYESGALRSIWLAAPPTLLMVEHVETARPRVDGLASGAFLLAFPMAAEERLHKRGVLITRGVAIESESMYSIYFRDPEQNRVALSSWPLPSQE